MSKHYNVYGIGNALVDVQYQVDDDYLSRMNVEKGGMTLVDETRQAALSDAIDATSNVGKRFIRDLPRWSREACRARRNQGSGS